MVRHVGFSHGVTCVSTGRKQKIIQFVVDFQIPEIKQGRSWAENNCMAAYWLHYCVVFFSEKQHILHHTANGLRLFYGILPSL